MTSSKSAILVVSFGTSYNDNRDRTIGATEREIAALFPEREIRRAFTSGMVIKKLMERDGVHIDTVCEAMEKMISECIEDVIVQPTHVMNGKEYDSVVSDVSEYEDSFKHVVIGKPLLTTEEDYDNVVNALERSLIYEAEDIAGKNAAIVLMGHGTSHFANATYCQLHQKLQLSGHSNVFITTVEGFPTFEDTASMMKCKGYKDVVLFPFMLVAGDHANKDMAGEKDSLRSLMESSGYSVHCVVKGLGEYCEFRKLFVKHIHDVSDVEKLESNTYHHSATRTL